MNCLRTSLLEVCGLRARRLELVCVRGLVLNQSDVAACFHHANQVNLQMIAAADRASVSAM
jgi:hypothetical protein